ncbi:MAG: ADP-ribosylglycohydrolase family protein [Bacteroidota bacterium]
MLLEFAIGDAYGAGFEYVSKRITREHNDLSGYIQHPRHGTAPGCYTDDTQMTLAIAEAIVSGEPWTRAHLAQRFVEVYKRDPREGYARGFRAFLEEVRDGAEFLDRIRPESDKSGAAMRAVPIGVYPDVETVIARSRLQAAITHGTPGGVAASVATSLMAHYFLYDLGPKADMPAFIATHVEGAWTTPWRGKVGAKGMMSAHAALTVVTQSESLGDMLQRCIAFTGDVDTVATIALGAASCSSEIQQDLPDVLVSGLEGGPYGRAYLQRLDVRLRAAIGFS